MLASSRNPLFAVFLLAAALHAQDDGQMETSIPGGIADGTPAPPAPKPEPIPFEVKSSVSRRVFVKRAPEMPGLPDPPPPLPALPPDDPAVLGRMAELAKEYGETPLVFVSATVYDHSRTYLRCYPSGGGRKEISAWKDERE